MLSGAWRVTPFLALVYVSKLRAVNVCFQIYWSCIENCS